MSSMTTYITELAQSLKAAAEKAQIEEGLTWFSEEQLSHEDGIALHKADAEFIAMANPANTLALVEALEKAQQHIARQEQILLNQDESLSIRRGELEKAQAQSSKWLEAYHKAVSIGARYEERIAELESRTVKLPPTVSVAGIDVYEAGLVRILLTAAGIKWEAE